MATISIDCAKVPVDNFGRICIPSSIRDEMGIGPGDKVELLYESKGNYRLRAAVPKVEHCVVCGKAEGLIRLGSLCLCTSCAQQVLKNLEERGVNHEISEST